MNAATQGEAGLPPLPPKWAGYFRKLPVTVPAVQLTPENAAEVWEWTGQAVKDGQALDVTINVDKGLTIRTLEGDLRTPFGWWVVKGVGGEFHPVRADIFAETYEAVTDAVNGQGAPGQAAEPFPEGCTCLELEDSQRSPDPDCPVPAHHAEQARKLAFDSWFGSTGYDDQGRFDQDEMEFAFEAGWDEALAARLARDAALPDTAQAGGDALGTLPDRHIDGPAAVIEGVPVGHMMVMRGTIAIRDAEIEQLRGRLTELEAERDRERAERLHCTGERDEARSDLVRMWRLLGEVLGAFKGRPLAVEGWRERADLIMRRHIEKAAAEQEAQPGKPAPRNIAELADSLDGTETVHDTRGVL